MSRQLAEIQETHARLTELHRQATSPRMRNRLRMLMLLHDNPERPLADVARELECAERSVLRWWSIYRGGGLDALMETRHKGRPSQLSKVDIGEVRAQIAEAGMTGLDDIRAWLADRHGLRYSRSGMSYVMREILRVSRNVGWLLLDDDLTGSESPENGESPALDNPAAVINLLNSLPMTDDVVEWGNGFRAVLQRLLPDVDRISVNVNRSCDIRRPEDYVMGTRVNRAIMDSEGAGDTRITVGSHRRDEAPSVRVLEEFRAKGVPLHEFHPPVIGDYYYHGTAYLGSIFLWRGVGNPGISEETLQKFDVLRPFIEFAFSDLVARHQVSQPVAGVFAHAANQMFEDAGLSKAEKRVVTLALLGQPYKDIADNMAVTLDAVKKHFHTIFKKTGTRSQADLFAKYFTAQLRREQSSSSAIDE